MLLTMPVLIAFYALLSTAIELRGAPFFGWIHDLSVHDPLYITPVLMGVTMVWQQKLAPAAGADPTQQKMMMFMPIVFTVMFLWAPAGVAVYWFMSNLWAIGQQYLTNYLIGPPNVRSVRPPAERQMKRARERRARPKRRRANRSAAGADPDEAIMADATAPIIEFLNRFTAALGVNAVVNVEQTADGPRINLSGDEAELLVRHRGEPLKALQHVVDMAYGRGLPGESAGLRRRARVSQRQRRRTAADGEAPGREGAADRNRSAARPAQSVRTPHRPPGGRRDSRRATESIGDAFSKTVLISKRK